MMAEEELEKYTKEIAHHGVNEEEILGKFMDYASGCSDPENIFRYMEEKAICTFLSSFWIHKAEYLAEVGDYAGCFECVELAKDRRQIEEEASIDINKKQAELVSKFMSDMRTFPIKSKRSLEEFQFTTNQGVKQYDKDGLKKSYQKILPIYEAKYGGLRKEKEKQFKKKTEKFPLSWLAEQYEKQEIQQKRIEEKIHQNSVRLSKEVKYHSMHTPIKYRDPQRLTKTMDSVEILRKKRSTNEKVRNNRKFQRVDSDEEFEDVFEISNSNSKLVASVPVGKTFSSLKRRVTFDMMDIKKGNINFSDTKTSPEVGLKSKNITNNIAETFSADRLDENSQKFKSLPPHHSKLK